MLARVEVCRPLKLALSTEGFVAIRHSGNLGQSILIYASPETTKDLIQSPFLDGDPFILDLETDLLLAGYCHPYRRV